MQIIDAANNIIKFFQALLDPRTWVIILVVLILGLLALRKVLTWYWKTDQMIELLKEIEKNTEPKNGKEKNNG